MSGITRHHQWLSHSIRYAGLLTVLVLLIAFFGVMSQGFFQLSTLSAIANKLPALTFLAVGMTWVLIIGGIDLSVGSLLALASATLGVLMTSYQWPIIPSLLVTGFVLSVFGAFNGLITVGFGIPSFIVTLGTLEIARGVTKVVTDSQTIFIGSRVEWFGQPINDWWFSPAFAMASVLVLVGQFVLSCTVFGRYCLAIGNNAQAVRMSGIRSGPYCVSVFVISGFMCALAGLAHTARLSTADPNAGIGIELQAIAACVIGGTSLMGGRGSVICTFLGVLIIQTLETGLAQLGVTDAQKQVVTGSVIVVAVLLDVFRSSWSKRET